MLMCREVTRLVSESNERSLSLRERLALRLHMMMCDGCRNFGVQARLLRRFARAFARGANEPPQEGSV